MERLKIYIDRLRDGQKVIIEEMLDPAFMQIEETELQFREKIALKIEAYLAEDHLVLYLSATTKACLPCAICNQSIETPLVVRNKYVTIALDDIKKAVFDTVDEVRESILLQTPLFTECAQGQCPERANIQKFLKAEPVSKAEEKTYFPFSDCL